VLTKKNVTLFLSKGEVNPKKVALIFLPGALTESTSYAPALRRIALAGHNVALVSMPLRMAPLGQNRVMEAIDILDNEKSTGAGFVLGGHSLGGVVASDIIESQKSIRGLKGIVFWASRTNKKKWRNRKDLKVLSLLGTNDGVINSKLLEESLKCMPLGMTTIVQIKGGNHTQFGCSYRVDGPFSMKDKDPEISLEEQEDRIVRETVSFLRKIDIPSPMQ